MSDKQSTPDAPPCPRCGDPDVRTHTDRACAEVLAGRVRELQGENERLNDFLSGAIYFTFPGGVVLASHSKGEKWLLHLPTGRGGTKQHWYGAQSSALDHYDRWRKARTGGEGDQRVTRIEFRRVEG